MRSSNSSLICILGWLKSDLGVVLLFFGLVWNPVLFSLFR